MFAVGGFTGLGYHTQTSFEFARVMSDRMDSSREAGLPDHNLLITSACKVLCFSIRRKRIVGSDLTRASAGQSVTCSAAGIETMAL